LAESLFIPCSSASVGTLHSKRPLDGDESRNSYSRVVRGLALKTNISEDDRLVYCYQLRYSLVALIVYWGVDIYVQLGTEIG
jgi:hypothetical protein